jgi:phage shock protein E
MKIFIFVIVAIFGVGFNYLLAQNNPSPAPPVEYRTISPAEAKKRLEAEARIILLDVRTPEEYAEQHIPGSILIPVDQLEQAVEAKIPAKHETIFIYCRSGRRSKIAADKLIGLGYTHVYDLGGIFNWPYEVETGQ